MQSPTCTNVRIRSTHDAHKIFLAVQKGILVMVNRRLDADERHALCSGCIYAWEERGPHTEITGLGIERFTEGRRWSPSRVRDEFLFYYEKYSPPQDGSQNGRHSEKQPPRDWDPLVKQTYSVWVETEKGRRKWHLTAYFTQATVDQLGTVDDLPEVGGLVVPTGLFQSTRVGKNRKVDDSQTRNASTNEPLKPAMTSSLPRNYAPFPATNPRRRRSSSPPKPAAPKLYESFSNVNQTQGQTLFTDTQMSQFSLASQPPIVQVPLPPLRDIHQPSSDARREPSTGQNFSGYSSQDTFERSSSLGNSLSRAEDTYTSVELTGTEIKISSGNARISPPQAPLSTPQRVQADPLYLPVTETRGHTVPCQLTSPWFSSPITNEATLDHQSLSFPIRNDMTTPYPIRSSFSPLLGPSLSVSPPQQPVFSQPESFTYTPLQSDPQVQSHAQPYISSHPHSSPYARLRIRTITPHAPQQASPTTSHSSIQSPGVDDSYVPVAAFDGHPAEPCGFENENRRSSVGPSRVDLAPLHALQRSHPYRRDPVDDRALRMLGPRSS